MCRSSKQEWQVMVEAYGEVMQRNVRGSRQRRILFWTLMRQRVFATAQKLPPLRLHQPLTFTCFHSGLSHINTLYETFTCIPISTVAAITPGHVYKTSLLPSIIRAVQALFIATTGDRGDLRPSNVMLHCTTRYWTPHGRSPLFRI